MPSIPKELKIYIERGEKFKPNLNSVSEFSFPFQGT